jgi:hypothetical protein
LFGGGTSPQFFVNVASRAFSDSASGFEATFAECSAGVDFKEDTDVADSGALRGARGLNEMQKRFTGERPRAKRWF